MKHALLPLIATSALLITACQSRPVSVSDAKPAPQARIFKYQSPAASTLVVLRDKSMVGAGCDASIFINGETVAKLETGEKVTFHLDA
ncbi:hypothetical protein BL791_RS27870, partial [Escherichia coli]|nr:hypothetical protein [Escherichia coli]